MGGRRHKLNAEQRAHAVKLHKGGDHTVKEISAILKTLEPPSITTFKNNE